MDHLPVQYFTITTFPRATPLKFPPLGAKSSSNAPPISTELPLLNDKFRLQSNTLHAFQREICRNDTFKFLLRPYWKSNLPTKAKFYLVNPSNPARTEKTHERFTSEQEINPVQIPHPFNATFKFPPARARCTVKCPGCARGGGMLKFRIDRRISLSRDGDGVLRVDKSRQFT